jgi:hypothetical protein
MRHLRQSSIFAASHPGARPATVCRVTCRPNRAPRRRAARRSALLRLFALLVAVLALNAQQRVVKAVHLLSATTIRAVAERPETVESDALRAEPSLRIARAPFLTRLPVATNAVLVFGSAGESSLLVRAARGQRVELVTHFHAKRRIPRMNSEEPPRA